VGFALATFEAGSHLTVDPTLETALLLLDGEVTFTWGDHAQPARRTSVFDGEPTVLHVPAGTDAAVTARQDAEIAVFTAFNARTFAPALFVPGALLQSEHRGLGQLDDTAFRIVRTVFDLRNRPDAALVLGEVITLPGRWSSYPPHHHAQPEIYHYRFLPEHGYGHAEVGDDVRKVHHRDTVFIEGDRDHPQVAAPGYAMYYIWVVRHLPDLPYTGFTFTDAHRWLTETNAPTWRPRP